MSRERHRRYGWADDIIAPRQEFDTLAALDQEAWVQAALDRRRAELKDMSPEELLAAYKTALDEYRAQPRAAGADETRIAELLQDVELFGAQASAGARQPSATRVVVSFSCPDRPGIVAAAAVAMAEAGGNIEAAFMSVVARQLVMAFLVSGQAADDPADLQERLESSLSDLGQVSLAVVPMEADEVEWPRPRSTYWHLSARFSGDARLLLTATEVIADAGLPVLALSSWLEGSLTGHGEDVQVVDLNFAVSPALTVVTALSSFGAS